ncbi:inovirus Gp2 family protein [Desulfovibrio desulfuricans]|uniref:YagK/YfjJ domain-containing protein n=1 Tax=Desulfovibrio desulfuricans TaxID=876 RepID=UPI001D0627A3|nr:inovirus-type Gp2 protein [Desulfovibrio desulfuricans]MCB6543620.1 inovirus Gp2 family protein [Desulfovibrio desulfuricans]MCB6554698.1 inovirus Gp2 family protein [Desulfovibrio desulfuricans]MCB6566549.1 inovirus Gp2 family protein [Desulfovibrio desulfuricans]MCB7347725.1 inovirus Gp2 family protein [Desulfovibrio desulfuricans]MCQ5219618.1 inovirus Gp2 family protein [Desulfovibrio desulfuricans]
MNRINFSQTIKDYDPTMYRDSISQKISELLEEYTRTFSKTMIVRFDVTYPKTYIGVEDNSDMSALMKLLIQQCSRNGVSPAYFWVREQSLRSNNQHYHCMLLLDGNKTCRYYPYIELAEKIWGRILGVNPKGLIHFCDRDPHGNRQANGIILRSDDPYYEDKIATVVRQAMYMAKVHTKGFYNDGFRDFGMTRISSIPLLRKKFRGN